MNITNHYSTGVSSPQVPQYQPQQEADQQLPVHKPSPTVDNNTPSVDTKDSKLLSICTWLNM